MTVDVHPITCEQAQILASHCLDEPLEPHDEAAFQAHIEQCPSCRVETTCVECIDQLASEALLSSDLSPLKLDTRRLADETWSRLEQGEIVPEDPAVPMRVPIALVLSAAAVFLVIGAVLLPRPESADSTASSEVASRPELPSGPDLESRPDLPSRPDLGSRPDLLSRLGPVETLDVTISPRGVDLEWPDLASVESGGFVLERHAPTGEVVRFETAEPRFHDTTARAGEPYFYVVRRPEAMALIGLGMIAPELRHDDLSLRYLGGSPHAALIEVVFEEKGKRYSATFMTEVGEKVGGRDRVTVEKEGETEVVGGDFRTPFRLFEIQWDAKRTIFDPELGKSREVPSRCIVLSTPDGTPRTLWIRE